MKLWAIIISFIFHPIWFPIYGVFIFFYLFPLFLPIEEFRRIWTSAVLVSVLLPTLVYTILIMSNWLKTPFHTPLNRRKWLIYGYILVILIMAMKITTIQLTPILYFYMINIAISCFLIVLFHFFKIFGSIYISLIGSLTGFLIFISIFYQIDLTYLLSACFFITGLITSARMFLSNYNFFAVILSWVIGFAPQIMLLSLIDG